MKLPLTYIGLFLTLFVGMNNSSAQPRRAKVPFPVYKKVDPERMINDIRDLASTAFEGRELGSDGNEKAVDWLSFKLEKTGLAPLFGNSYVEEFPITRYDLGSSNYFLLGNDSLKLYEDYLPAYYSTDAHIGASVVYAGYGFLPGIEKQLKDKIVIMHGITKQKLTSLMYLKTDTLALCNLSYPLFFEQAKWAEANGAAAVLFVPEERDFEFPFESGATYQFSKVIKIPAKAQKTMRHSPNPSVLRDRLSIAVLYVTQQASLRIMQSSAGLMESLIANARKGIVPLTQVFNRNVILGTQLNPVEKRFSHNIGGILHGKFGSPYLLIAAHMDGEGQHTSLGYPYIGANSNASGIAVLLELATILNSEEQPEYGIVFLIHNGAERDLAGLKYFLQHNEPVTKKIKGALLFDDLASGSIADSVGIYIRSLSQGSRFLGEAEKAIADYSYKAQYHPSTSFLDVRNILPFYDKRIATFELSGGVNSLKNRISDVPEKLNYVKMYRMTQFSLELIWRYNYTRNSALFPNAQ